MSTYEKSKKKILVVDDSELNRAILADMLKDDYEILEARDGVEAVATVQQHDNEIALMLLDIVMPKMDGFEVLKVMNKGGWIDHIPVIMISAEASSQYISKAYDMGVTDYIVRPFDSKVVHHKANNTIMLHAKQKMLQGMVTEQIYQREKQSGQMVEILSNIVEFRNGESGLHVLHVRMITEMILKKLAEKTDKYNLDKEKISMISTASMFHDIGKIAIDEKILNKPGRFTAEEFEIMKTHAAIGADMLKKAAWREGGELLELGYDICRWHHERYDGRGYPDGLAGEEIPIWAQAVAMADVYEALTSKRVYKPAYMHEKSLLMIVDGECGAFNPLLIECLKELAPALKTGLKLNAVREAREYDMQNGTGRLMDKGEAIASDRTLKLLEKERIKYQFFASMSQEIQFEYDRAADMVILPAWSAKHFGIDELIMCPMKNKKLKQILSAETLEDIKKKILAATPKDTIIKGSYCIRVGDRDNWHKLTMRVMWEDEEALSENAVFTGVIGKFANVDNDYRRMDNLKQMASHDMLTGLYNHMSGRALIEEKISSGGKKKFGMILFDLDYFKHANDYYGHLFGDEVLQHVAERLRDNLRQEDIIIRVGGDEFLVFMEYTGDFEAQVSRVFRAVTGQYGSFYISVSMGASTLPEHGTDYEKLFYAADQALYTSKRGGRNQYKFYDDSMKGTLSVLSPIDGDR